MYNYHEHNDGNGNIINDDYIATSGGCYTNNKDVYETVSILCTSTYYYAPENAWNCFGNCTRCGEVYLTVASSNLYGQYLNHTHSIGKYYWLNCGKTTDTIESATIIY